VNPGGPDGFPIAAIGGPRANVNSFFSLLQQSSTTLANDEESDPAGNAPLEMTPADRAVRNNKGLNALLMNAASESIAPAQNQPLPLSLSFNIFGMSRDSKNSITQTTTEPAAEAPIQNAPIQKESTPASLSPLAPQIQIPAPVSNSRSSRAQEPASPADGYQAETEVTPALPQQTAPATSGPIRWPLPLTELWPLLWPPILFRLPLHCRCADRRMERSRPQKSTSARAAKPAPKETMPPAPTVLAPTTPTSAPANSIPTSEPTTTTKTDSGASADAAARSIEPRRNRTTLI